MSIKHRIKFYDEKMEKIKAKDLKTNTIYLVKDSYLNNLKEVTVLKKLNQSLKIRKKSVDPYPGLPLEFWISNEEFDKDYEVLDKIGNYYFIFSDSKFYGIDYFLLIAACIIAIKLMVSIFILILKDFLK
jgi:hypothetical protein